MAVVVQVQEDEKKNREKSKTIFIFAFFYFFFFFCTIMMKAVFGVCGNFDVGKKWFSCSSFTYKLNIENGYHELSALHYTL